MSQNFDVPAPVGPVTEREVEPGLFVAEDKKGKQLMIYGQKTRTALRAMPRK